MKIQEGFKNPELWFGSLWDEVWILKVPWRTTCWGLVFRVELWEVIDSFLSGAKWEEVRSLGVCPPKGQWSPNPVLLLPDSQCDWFCCVVYFTMMRCSWQTQSGCSKTVGLKKSSLSYVNPLWYLVVMMEPWLTCPVQSSELHNLVVVFF